MQPRKGEYTCREGEHKCREGEYTCRKGEYTCREGEYTCREGGLSFIMLKMQVLFYATFSFLLLYHWGAFSRRHVMLYQSVKGKSI
jgi:hypothetical protein